MAARETELVGEGVGVIIYDGKKFYKIIRVNAASYRTRELKTRETKTKVEAIDEFATDKFTNIKKFKNNNIASDEINEKIKFVSFYNKK